MVYDQWFQGKDLVLRIGQKYDQILPIITNTMKLLIIG